jgi:hypothetical protein
MWSFGHSVREVERSHDHVVIEETATTGAVWIFGGLVSLVLLLWLTRPKPTQARPSEEAVGALAVIFFTALALWASVRATYTADRRKGLLVIERRILFWTVRSAYDAYTIDRVYVRDTQKGSGLYVRFKSGRKKRLSVSMEFTSLEPLAIALNTALYTHHER